MSGHPTFFAEWGLTRYNTSWASESTATHVDTPTTTCFESDGIQLYPFTCFHDPGLSSDARNVLAGEW
jgi:hypothetical protein